MAEAVLNAPTSPNSLDTIPIKISKKTSKQNEFNGRERLYSSDSSDLETKIK